MESLSDKPDEPSSKSLNVQESLQVEPATEDELSAKSFNETVDHALERLTSLQSRVTEALAKTKTTVDSASKILAETITASEKLVRIKEITNALTHNLTSTFLEEKREKELQKLASELHEDPHILFEKAIAFFKDAIAAERIGNRVVIVNKDYDVVTELSGFSSEAPSTK